MRPKSFFIPIVLPGLNQIIAHAKQRRGNWNSYSELKSSLNHEIGLFIREQRMGRFNKPVWLRFVWRERNKRRDPDNICAARKFVLDSLVKEGVIENDGWKQVVGWFDKFQVSPDNPGVYVTIEEAHK